jgi:pimeloyl-ACP methyl ester carboxylesterase
VGPHLDDHQLPAGTEGPGRFAHRRGRIDHVVQHQEEERSVELTCRDGKLPEGAGDQVQANLTVSGDPPVGVMSAAASRQALYECCADDVAADAIARQLPQPVAPFVMPVSLPAGVLDRIPQYAVVCTRDRAIPPVLQRRMSKDNACADVVDIDTDHTPQLSRPKDLAEALDRFAKHVAHGRS